jgi:hypothetical protein
MNLSHTLAALLVASLLATPPAAASDDHDHGDATPAATGAALPRFSAVSETFELVGVLSGRQLTLYLDRFADNSPVRGAQIELEIGSARFQATRQGDDQYEVVMAEAPRPGVLPITATVTAGSESDLLAGELDIHAPTGAGEAAAHTPSWTRLAGWAAAGIAGLSLLAWGARRVLGARRVRAGGAA